MINANLSFEVVVNELDSGK